MGEGGGTAVTRELERLLNKDISNKAQLNRNYTTRFASDNYTPNLFTRMYNNIKNYFTK